MADIELVIKIPEDIYEISKKECEENDVLIIDTFTYAIGNGKPLEEELEKIKNEIQGLIDFEESCCGDTILGYQCLGVIEDIISELKGENKK